MAGFQRPDPRTGTDSGTGSGNGGKGRNNRALQFEDFLPGQLNALSGQLSRFGGTEKAWKSDLRDMTAPMEVGLPKPFHRGGGRNKGGGKTDPDKPGTGPDTVTGDFDPSRPDHKIAQMQAMPGQMPMQRGFLPVTQPLNQAPTTGLFAAQQQMQQPMQGQQPQLPPEILAMMRARQMGR